MAPFRIPLTPCPIFRPCTRAASSVTSRTSSDLPQAGGDRALMGRFFGTGYGGVSTVEKRASRFLVIWGYVPIHAPGARHDSLGRIIARARDRVTADAAPLATAGIRPRPVEFCDGAGATLRHHRWGGGDCAAGRTRGSDGAPALARVALRDRAHSRDQTRGHASGARCDYMFRAAPALGAGLAVPDGIAGDPRYGCAYVGPTLHRAGDPPDLSGLCAPDGLGRAASTPERGVAVSLGTAVHAHPAGSAHGMDGHRDGGSRVVCAMAGSPHPGAGLAPLAADQGGGNLSCGGRGRLSPTGPDRAAGETGMAWS
jgi:hypothetical protein